MGLPPGARDRPLAYLAALEEELRKIQAFQRELPLSLDLVARTIEDFKQEVLATPVLEEFIPLKGSSRGPDGEGERSEDSDAQDKADWLRSAQLWNQHQQQQQLDLEMAGADAMEAEGPPPADGEGSDAGSEGGRGAAAAADQMRKKERRCWSPDLHRKFVDALQRLGGPEVATPKQIKELMSVEGLTNDEIKSHLQKYRKRLNKSAAQPTAAVNAAVNQQPQVLLGIWVPQGDYAAVAAAAAAAISSLPVEPKQKKQRKAKQARRNGAGPVVIWPQNATSTGSNTTSI